jgi:hypothetical protein
MNPILAISTKSGGVVNEQADRDSHGHVQPSSLLLLLRCGQDSAKPVNSAGHGWVTASERELKDRPYCSVINRPMRTLVQERAAYSTLGPRNSLDPKSTLVKLNGYQSALGPHCPLRFLSWLLLFTAPVLSEINLEPLARWYGPTNSQSGLNTLASELFPTAIDGSSEDFRVRIALERSEIKVGEPLHLFVYIANDSQVPIPLPNCEPERYLRIEVLNDQWDALPRMPSGDFIERSSHGLDNLDSRLLNPSAVCVLHVDLTELVDIAHPGQYSLLTKCVFFSSAINPDPKSADFPIIGFRVVAADTTNSEERPKSNMWRFIDRHLRLNPPSRPLSPWALKVLEQARGDSTSDLHHAPSIRIASMPESDSNPPASVDDLPLPRVLPSVDPLSPNKEILTISADGSPTRTLLVTMTVLLTFVLWLVLRRFR